MWVDIASQTQIWQPCIPQDRADLLKQLLWVYFCSSPHTERTYPGPGPKGINQMQISVYKPL